MADGSVFLSRYADVVAVYKDTATFSSDKHEEFGPKYGDSPLFEHHTTSLVFNDPPLHTRVRRLIAGALTPRHIAAMEQRLVERVDSLLDVMAARGRGAEIDLIAGVRERDPGRDHRQPARRAERGARRRCATGRSPSSARSSRRSRAEQLERGNRAVREFLRLPRGPGRAPRAPSRAIPRSTC